MPDPYIHLSLTKRIRMLRRACRYSQYKLARILGVKTGVVARIEAAGRKPARVLCLSYLLPRLRLMEEAFARQLAEEYAHPHKWGPMVKQYSKYNGNNHKIRLHPDYSCSNRLPDDPKYIELLGGIAVFGTKPTSKRASKHTEEE